MAATAMASSPAIHLRHPPPPPPPPPLLQPLSTSSPYPWLSAWSHPHPRRLRPPAPALDLRREPSPSSDSDDEDAVGTSTSSGRSTMSLILRRLQRAGYAPEEPAPAAARRSPPRGSVEDVFRALTTACSPTRAAGSTTTRRPRLGTRGSPGNARCRLQRPLRGLRGRRHGWPS
ncbi:hypothetical protein PR202_ga22024 [Eleusine coracana subsp. coracana]|uniref:Uncharacterized protein n=1 Tax=Eleusine coracana subsp. coracana TaxID=191504 RepID=A0AAV5D2J3_ELECO|nr:hypothetical protein PR202_ga22024 [Eleusine coracana subsp. coracana]